MNFDKNFNLNFIWFLKRLLTTFFRLEHGAIKKVVFLLLVLINLLECKTCIVLKLGYPDFWCLTSSDALLEHMETRAWCTSPSAYLGSKAYSSVFLLPFANVFSVFLPLTTDSMSQNYKKHSSSLASLLTDNIFLLEHLSIVNLCQYCCCQHK